MTKFVAYNQQQLDIAYQEMCRVLEETHAINLDFSEYKKPKTKKQLGFMFGCIVGAVLEFYHKLGDKSWTEKAVCRLFYDALSPKIKMVKLNGDIFEYPKQISEMNREEMSNFIDDCIHLIDRAKCFQGLVLHPSVRNTWIHNVTLDDILAIDSNKFPRKCPEYLEYRRKQCCIICGKYGCEAHHIRESEDAGISRKANDWETISMCKLCHAKYHDCGSKQFKDSLWWILDYLDLNDFVKCQFSRWYNGFR